MEVHTEFVPIKHPDDLIIQPRNERAVNGVAVKPRCSDEDAGKTFRWLLHLVKRLPAVDGRTCPACR